jgi:hypothetical protein
MKVINFLFYIYGHRKNIFFILLACHGSFLVGNKFYFLYYKKTIGQYNQEEEKFYKLKRKLFILTSYSNLIKIKQNS